MAIPCGMRVRRVLDGSNILDPDGMEDSLWNLREADASYSVHRIQNTSGFLLSVDRSDESISPS
jgi:hypothetical protein